MESYRVKNLALLALLVSLPALSADIPLRNWSVPPYSRAAGSSGGLSTMTDISLGVSFVAVTPCRVVDTRPSQGFAGAYGPPIMAANAIRPFDINSAPHCPGIPAGVDAYSLNFTVTETTGQPGDVRAFPAGASVPNVSTLNWNFLGAGALANGIIVAAGGGGSINVLIAGFATHLVIDINGYFSQFLNDNNYFEASGSYPASGVIFARNASAAGGSSSLRGLSSGAGPVFGVHGAVSATVDGATGVRGNADGTTGATYGVGGVNNSATNGSAGVLGIGHARAPNPSFFLATGLRGESDIGNGVLGLIPVTSSGYGVAGFSHNGTTTVRVGRLADEVSDLGVSYFGGLGGSGTKNFLEPHPTDAGKMIRYVSLEGPEAGTYFRGKARFQNGLAEISVPESFRMVSDPESLSIQVTPIGQMATYAVQSIALDRIVVRGSRNVEFFYLVHGVRKAYKDFEIIAPNNFFVPESANSRMPGSLSPDERQRLIDNGTYHADGTVNLETAERLGWDRIWVEREHPAPRPVEP